MGLGLGGVGEERAWLWAQLFLWVVRSWELQGVWESECKLWELSLYCLWADACILGRA